jgi:hypothetical protein
MGPALALQIEYHKPSRIEELAEIITESLDELSDLTGSYSFDKFTFGYAAQLSLSDFAKLAAGSTVAAIHRNTGACPWELHHNVCGITFVTLLDERGR